MTKAQQIITGTIIEMRSTRYEVADFSGRKYRGKVQPQGTLAFHRWVASRNSYAASPTFYANADHVIAKGAKVVA